MAVNPETHLQQNITHLSSHVFTKSVERVHVDDASNFTELYGLLMDEGSESTKAAATALLRLTAAVNNVMPHGRQWVPDTFHVAQDALPHTEAERGLTIVGSGAGAIVLEKTFTLDRVVTRKVNLPPFMLGFAINSSVSPETVIRSSQNATQQPIALFSGRIERF